MQPCGLTRAEAHKCPQKMYVTMFPCNECSKLLIQAGIGEIVFYEDKAAPPVRYISPNEAPGNDIRWASHSSYLQYWQFLGAGLSRVALVNEQSSY